MSLIVELGNELENLPAIVKRYKESMVNCEDKIALKGKRLEHANREQASFLFFYDQRRAELKTILDFIDARVKRVRGDIFRRYTEKSNFDLSDRAKEQYINRDAEYLDTYELYLMIKEIFDKYCAIVDAFKARAYALNNITKIKTSNIEDDII